MEPAAKLQASPPSQSYRQHSCALCHQRKVKCDKRDPCSYCASRGVPCAPLTRSSPGPRKKRFPEAELLARLRAYEAALKSYGADINLITSRYNSDSAAVEVKTSTKPVSAELGQDRHASDAWPRNVNDVCFTFLISSYSTLASQSLQVINQLKDATTIGVQVH